MHDITVDVKDRIATVSINRESVANALNRHNKRQLRDFFVAADEDESIAAIIITGAGSRSFCAGTDLKDMATFTALDAEQMLKLEHSLNDAIRHCSKPVVAAVGGHALGGGLLLALMCDYTVVSEEAKLGFPEIKAGLPASIEIALIHRFVGLGRARKMIYFGEPFTASEALEMGLVNEVVPKTSVESRAQEIAKKFLALSPTALRLQKELINKWIEGDFNSTVEASIYAAALSFTTGEPQEAIEGFLAGKR